MQGRHVGYRFRRADNNEGNPNKKIDVAINPNNAEFWLKNWVVGPPIGAPHITLDVNSNLDDDIAEVLKNLDNNNEKKSTNENNSKQIVEAIDQNEKKNEQANKQKGSSDKPFKATKSVNKDQTSGQNSSSNGTESADSNIQSDGNKKNREKTNKSTNIVVFDLKSTAKDKVDNGQENKKQDDNRSNKTKESKPADSNGTARESKEEPDIGLDEYSFK